MGNPTGNGGGGLNNSRNTSRATFSTTITIISTRQYPHPCYVGLQYPLPKHQQHKVWTCQASPSLLPLHCSPPLLQVLIPSVKLDYSHVKSRCGSLDRRGYSAGGGNVSFVLQVHCLNVSGCCVSVVLRHPFFVFHPALASQFYVFDTVDCVPWGDFLWKADCLHLQDYFDAVSHLSFSELTNSAPVSSNLVTHWAPPVELYWWGCRW